MSGTGRRNKSGAIGTKAETAVVKVLKNWWPRAERRRLAGTDDRGDVLTGPGITWEVKGGEAARKAQPQDILDWMAETDREQAVNGDPVGILVVQRRGYGEARAGQWWAIITLRTWFTILWPDGIPVGLAMLADPDRMIRITLDDLCWALALCGWTDAEPIAGHPDGMPEPEQVPTDIAS